MKIGLFKLLDRMSGSPALRLLGSPKQKSLQVPSSILLIRPGGIGDAALLIPAIRTLQKAFRAAMIDILAEERNSAVFSFAPGIRRILHYDKPSELVSAIRGTYDLVLDTEQWHRLSAVAARLTRAPMLVGYATNDRKKLFTNPIDYSHDDYEINSFLRLLTPILHEPIMCPEIPFLTIPDGLTEKTRALLVSLSTHRIVAIFPGSSIEERRWGSNHFKRTAKLLSEQGYGVVAVGGKEDSSKGEDIVQGLPNSINLAGKLSLPETAAVLKQSELLITGDSGIMHIGYGLGIKLVALFGPGREKKWAPRGKNCIVINKHLPCSPCTTFGYTPKCKRNAECMQKITVDEVLKASMSLLKSDNPG